MAGDAHILNRIVTNRRFIVALGVFFLLLAAALTKHHPVSWNDSSRMATVEALRVHHTFEIDESVAFPTGDKYRYKQHFYSDKPPNVAIGGALVALVLERLGVPLDRNPDLAYYLITTLLDGLAYAVGLTALYRTLRLLSASAAWSACVTIVAGTATFLLPYATILNNHVVSAALVAVGFRLLVDPRSKLRLTVGGGFALALAASIDISFAIFVVLAPLLLIRRGLRRSIVPFAVAVVPVAALYFALNLALSGSFIPPAMNLTLWNYPGSVFSQHNLTGLAMQGSPGARACYAVDLLIGNHGLFVYMPILLLSVYGVVLGWTTTPQYRSEIAYVALGCALYVASYVVASNDYSGYSYGIRWYAGIVYLALVPLAFIERSVARSAALRLAFIVLTSVSALVAAVGLDDLVPPSNVNIPPFLYNVREVLTAHRYLEALANIAFAALVTALTAQLAGLTSLGKQLARARGGALPPRRPAGTRPGIVSDRNF